MKYLKEDGSLDVDRIDTLPLEEYTNVMGKLTQEQLDEYFSKQPLNESKGPTRPIYVDYTLEEELERGAAIAKDYLNKMREKYEKKQ